MKENPSFDVDDDLYFSSVSQAASPVQGVPGEGGGAGRGDVRSEGEESGSGVSRDTLSPPINATGGGGSH